MFSFVSAQYQTMRPGHERQMVSFNSPCFARALLKGRELCDLGGAIVCK